VVGAILATITMIEVWAYTQESIRPMLVPILLGLSAAKFVLVVGFYMHLRFDHPLFTGVFGFGLAVAASVITAVMFLFGQYGLPAHHG
jgi:cytochrome c oxidase subunit 4